MPIMLLFPVHSLCPLVPPVIRGKKCSISTCNSHEVSAPFVLKMKMFQCAEAPSTSENTYPGDSIEKVIYGRVGFNLKWLYGGEILQR